MQDLKQIRVTPLRPSRRARLINLNGNTELKCVPADQLDVEISQRMQRT